MITPQNGQPGVMGQQHGLQRLTDTLEALQHGQTAQQQRDTQMAQALQTLHDTLQWLCWAVGGLGAVVLVLGVLVGWHGMQQPETAYVRALGAVDSTLVQTWGSLPKAVQEQFSATYGRVGLVPPGKR